MTWLQPIVIVQLNIYQVHQRIDDRDVSSTDVALINYVKRCGWE